MRVQVLLAKLRAASLCCSQFGTHLGCALSRQFDLAIGPADLFSQGEGWAQHFVHRHVEHLGQGYRFGDPHRSTAALNACDRRGI
jgi:hypothetical protein